MIKKSGKKVEKKLIFELSLETNLVLRKTEVRHLCAANSTLLDVSNKLYF